MLFDDYWTEGLNQRQQQTIVDYINNGHVEYEGMGGYKSLVYPRKFLKSKKGREAVLKYLEFILDEKKGVVKEHLTRISYIRATFNPGDIIDADGKIRLPANGRQPENIEEVKDLKSLGILAYCIDGIKTKYDKMGRKEVVDIKLCNRQPDRDFLAKIFDLFNPEPLGITDRKPIWSMSDEERNKEIIEYLEKNKILALSVPEEKKDKTDEN